MVELTGAFVLAFEPAIRLAAFGVVFAAMAGLELARPRRPLTGPKGLRWFNNFAIVAINTLMLRLAFPFLAVGLAVWAQFNGHGLLNWLDAPGWIAVPLSVVLLDLMVYGQHVAVHHIRPLWRLHMMHHVDVDIDVTSGARFHPIEIALSMLLKMAVVVALGAPAVSVVIFEVLLNATAMFNHANVQLPLGLDRWLRLVVVTPDMHRVHHSVIPAETNSNYGFNLPWWDRLFHTYRPQPALGHLDMTIGLADYQSERRQKLGWMLLLPFRVRFNRQD
jgi:sterol desaturase/sphingolipid hydroxylase (fatty acid hydroxylase superfamily)